MGNERLIFGAIEKTIFHDLYDLGELSKSQYIFDHTFVSPLIVSGFLEGWEDSMLVNHLRYLAGNKNDIEAGEELEMLLGGRDDEVFYRTSEAYANWAQMARNYYERVSRMLYEGVFFIGSDADAKVSHLRGEMAFDTKSVLYFYYNPFLVTPSVAPRSEHVAEVLASLPPFVAYEQILKPSNIDISSSFYKGRTFFRLLEVDNSLVLPYGTNIKLSVTSDDVIHSWAVPSFGVKIDAIPGRINQSALVILHPGIFMGQCSELCGILHSFMPINVEAINPDVFFEEYNFVPMGRNDY